MLVQCWSSLCDAGPTLNHHWLKVPCFPGCYCLFTDSAAELIQLTQHWGNVSPTSATQQTQTSQTVGQLETSVGSPRAEPEFGGGGFPLELLLALASWLKQNFKLKVSAWDYAHAKSWVFSLYGHIYKTWPRLISSPLGLLEAMTFQLHAGSHAQLIYRKFI